MLIVSAFGGPGADNTIQALELGAIDFIEKPDGTTHTLEGFMKHLVGALQRGAAAPAGGRCRSEWGWQAHDGAAVL